MRRRRREVETWEPEALEAGQRLRQAMNLLREQEEALLAGPARDGPFEALETADRTEGSVLEWWQEWDVRTATLKTSRGVALSAYRGSLPPLLGAVALYSQSLAILATSPDPTSGDGELARRGAAAARAVSATALQFFDDGPALRAIDRAAVDATLKELEVRSRPMLALVGPIGDRARELADDGRY
jgi:hypothetical protein